MNINERISLLRNEMRSNNLDGYIIPSSDAHQSEYVAGHWEGRKWISGFTGSAGIAIITQDQAALWTDSRYFLQAEQELANSEFQLHKPKDRFKPEHLIWLSNILHKNATIGIDGNVCSIGQFDQMQRIFKPKNISVQTKFDLLDTIWKDRAEIPKNPIFQHDVKYAGKDRKEKIDAIRDEMNHIGADIHLISTLDDIAWILNIRGNDVEFNPVVIAYLLIEKSKTHLFIDSSKVSERLKKDLINDHVILHDYNSIIDYCNQIHEDVEVLLDPTTTNVNVYRAINAKVKNGKIISRLMKAKKNAVEIAHTKIVMARDGAALAKTFYWMEQKLKENHAFTEADLADKIAENRSAMENYVGESFPAIIGYKGNGAIIHYRPIHGRSHNIKPEGILLTDSGGQYLDGTTDISRTFALGTPTKEQKRNFTLVLKGHIALNKATFPQGTCGAQLDVLARMHLWDHGLNYGHGTGHGVGFFLNVHEPPQGFASISSGAGRVPLEIGMITSNEPGYYKEGEYGIRTENLIITVPAKTEGFLEFDTISLYPIDIKLIDEAIFTKSEKAWLNQYHQEVKKKVSPYLSGDVLSWFELKCRPMN